MTDDDLGAEAANENEQDAQIGDEAEPVDPIAALRAETAELNDRLLRATAEMDNLRKRTAREIQDSRLYSIAGFARDMLTATDNLTRALGALPEAERKSADGTLKLLIEGVELTEREMQRLLEKHGVSPIEAKGARFDPHVHQAMFEVTDTDAADNTVVEVVQPGYMIGERVLRPAMVAVARRTKKPAGEAAEMVPGDGAEAAGETPTGEPEDGGIDKTV